MSIFSRAVSYIYADIRVFFIPLSQVSFKTKVLLCSCQASCGWLRDKYSNAVQSRVGWLSDQTVNEGTEKKPFGNVLC